MNERVQDCAFTATALREAFDTSFAAAAPDTRPEEEFLLLGVRDQSFAVRLQDVIGLQADRKITPLPSPNPALHGLAALSGTLVPVFRLSALLGFASGAPSKWILLSGRQDVVGFAFDRFLGHVRVPPGEIAQVPEGQGHLPCITRLAPAGIAMIPVLDLPILVEDLRQQALTAGLSQER